MGLANRVVPKGQSRREAEILAQQIAAFPQTCLRNDRSSVYEQFDLPFTQAMENEFSHGMKALASGEGKDGAARFAAGEGRSGASRRN